MLSRAVVAASPCWGTCWQAWFSWSTGLLAWASFRGERVGRLVKAEPTLLVQPGQVLQDMLRQTHRSEKDLLEGLHEQGNLVSLDQVGAMHLERDGSLSVVKKAAVGPGG